MGILKKAGKWFLSYGLAGKAVTGSINEIKPSAKVLTDNVKFLLSEYKKSRNEDERSDLERDLDDSLAELNGRDRFKAIMIKENMTPKVYQKYLAKVHRYHKIYFVAWLIAMAFLTYLVFQGEYFLSITFMLLSTVYYTGFAKHATEVREQEFFSYAEFLPNYEYWFPTTKRYNEYYELSNEDLKIADINTLNNMTDYQEFKKSKLQEMAVQQEIQEQIKSENP